MKARLLRNRFAQLNAVAFFLKGAYGDTTKKTMRRNAFKINLLANTNFLVITILLVIILLHDFYHYINNKKEV